jgi:hypothetical protein
MLFCTRRPYRLQMLSKRVLLHRRSQNVKETDWNGVLPLSYPSVRAVAEETHQGDIALMMLAKRSLLDQYATNLVSTGSSDVFAGTDSFGLGNRKMKPSDVYRKI